MSTPLWPNGARAAVSLSYDDAMACHRTLVAPALEAHGLRGTFYAPFREELVQFTEDWRDMARRGHELGNHTLFHPCRREVPQPDDWISTWNNLVNFDAGRFGGEVAAANFMLQLIDGRTERTYGNTCHDVWIGPADDSKQRIEPILAQHFVAGRGVRTSRPTDPGTADLMNLGCTGADGAGFAEWRASIEQAVDEGGYLLFCFHGVGPDLRRLHVAEAEHTQLLEYLRDQAGTIWSAPVVDVARRIREHQAQ